MPSVNGALPVCGLGWRRKKEKIPSSLFYLGDVFYLGVGKAAENGDSPNSWDKFIPYTSIQEIVILGEWDFFSFVKLSCSL